MWPERSLAAYKIAAVLAWSGRVQLRPGARLSASDREDRCGRSLFTGTGRLGWSGCVLGMMGLLIGFGG